MMLFRPRWQPKPVNIWTMWDKNIDIVLSVDKRYAVLPTGTDSGKCVWLKHYYEIIYMKGSSVEQQAILTEKEHLAWLLKTNGEKGPV